MLQLGADHASRLLVQRLVVPRGVHPRQSLGHPVVLPRPQQVHRGQVEILVRPRVACRETVPPSTSLGFTVAAVVGIPASWQEGSIVGGQLHPQTAAPELTQILGRALVRPVNRRSVYERRHLQNEKRTSFVSLSFSLSKGIKLSLSISFIVLVSIENRYYYQGITNA